MYYKFLSIAPPIIAVLLAILVKSNVVGLGMGVVTSGMLAEGFHLTKSFKLTAFRIWETTELGNFLHWSSFINSDKLFAFIFLVVLGIVIAMVKKSGDFLAIANFFKDKIKSEKAAQLLVLCCSLPFFIEEYLSVIVSSLVMPALTDKFKISRLKLSYLITAIAKPLCPLIPVSSWGAVISMFLFESGITKSDSGYVIAQSFMTYIYSIPFMFFSLLVIFSAFFVVLANIRYGVVGQYEDIAKQTGNLFGGRIVIPEYESWTVDDMYGPKGDMVNLFLPIASICFGILAGFLCTGNFWLLGGEASFFQSIKNAVPGRSIFLGAMFGLFFTPTWLYLRKQIDLDGILQSIPKGVALMARSVIVLTLAWTFAAMISKDLKIGQLLASKLLPILKIEFVPATFFIVSAIMAFMIGSSWGTIALVTPIAVPMLTTLYGFGQAVGVESVPVIYPLIGAIIGGSLFGITISPVSNLLKVNSTNTKVDHDDYLKAQLEYISPVGISCVVAFVIAGMTAHWGYLPCLSISLVSGLGLVISSLITLNFVFGTK